MPKRFGTLAAATLAVVAATMAWVAPAQADTPGFTAKITSAPDTFTVGKDAHTVSAAVSTDRPDLRRCLNVRWVLIVSTQGVSLNQIKINRAVPVRAQLQEDSIRVIDAQVDPGQLCRGQTVTAKWTVSFVGPDNGSVTFLARALSQQGRVLASADASSRVVTAVADKPSKSPDASASASPTASPTFTPEPAQSAVVAPIESRNVDPAALAKNTSGLNVLLPGLIVGAVLVFVGIALLMRLRSRNRRNRPGGPPGWHQDTQTLPTGFYDMPRRPGGNFR